MSKIAEYLEKLHVKKFAAVNFIVGLQANHPHRMAGANLSGSMSLTIDQREFTSPPYTAYVWTCSADFSTFPAFTRRFVETCKFWIAGAPCLQDVIPTGSDMYLIQNTISNAWAMTGGIGGSSPYVEATVGSITKETYTASGDGGAYELQNTETFDTILRFGLEIIDGGFELYGGYDGATGATIGFYIEFDEESGISDPYEFQSITAERMPWDNTWASVDLSEPLDDYVAAGNTNNGGGYSGSCSLTLNFT